jgi:hypothetical protein
MTSWFPTTIAGPERPILDRPCASSSCQSLPAAADLSRQSSAYWNLIILWSLDVGAWSFTHPRPSVIKLLF